MAFTRKQLNFIRKCLAAAVFVFIAELVFPHVSLAANENYLSLKEGGTAKFEYTILGPEPIEIPQGMIIARNEKLEMAEDEDATMEFLPLEGDPAMVEEHWLTVTAYSSEFRQTDSTPFTTAWQTPVRDGVVALNFLPKGTMVRFPDMFGDKIFIVEDRMNIRYPYRADIWMYETLDAKQFGIKYLRMEELNTVVPRSYVLNHYEPAFPGMK